MSRTTNIPFSVAAAPAPTPVPPPNPGASKLADLAASMARGTWAALVVPNQQQVLGIATNPIPPGGGGQSTQFANKMPWNSFSKTIDMMIADHYGTGSNMQFVRYLEASNAFKQEMAPGTTGVTGLGHGYDHTCVNPTNGDLYHHKYNSNQNYRKKLSDATFASIGAGDAAAHQVAEAVCWWSGTFNGAGAQGCYIVFATGIVPGALSAWDPLTSAWFWNGAVATPGYGDCYHTAMQYSKVKNCAVFGGGSRSASSKKTWRLNADRSITPMPDAAQNIGPKAGIFDVDPVSGNFLLLAGGQLYELNPDGAEKWTQQTGGRVPPSAVGVPTAANTGVISCSIPDYGVIAYSTVVSTGSPCSFYLYKH
jgi:hypothetical protein